MLWNLVHFILCLKCQCLAATSFVIFGVLHIWTVSESKACPSQYGIKQFLGLGNLSDFPAVKASFYTHVKITLNKNLLK